MYCHTMDVEMLLNALLTDVKEMTITLNSLREMSANQTNKAKAMYSLLNAKFKTFISNVD